MDPVRRITDTPNLVEFGPERHQVHKIGDEERDPGIIRRGLEGSGVVILKSNSMGTGPKRAQGSDVESRVGVRPAVVSNVFGYGYRYRHD